MKQNGEIKYLNGLINGLKLKQRLYFKCMQHFHAIQSNWKNNLNNLVKSNFLYKIEKIKSRELYCIINSSHNNKHNLQIHFEKKFVSKELDWRFSYKNYHKHIFKLPQTRI